MNTADGTMTPDGRQRIATISDSILERWKPLRSRWFQKVLSHLDSVPELVDLVVKRTPDGDADSAMRAFQMWYVDGFLDQKSYLPPPDDQALFASLLLKISADNASVVDHFLRRYSEEGGSARFARFKDDIGRHIHPGPSAVVIGVALTHLLPFFLVETGIAVTVAFGDAQTASQLASSLTDYQRQS